MKSPQNRFLSWPDLKPPPGVTKSAIEMSKDSQQQRTLTRQSVIYGKKLAERKGFLEALEWASYARNPHVSSGESFNVVAVANEKLRNGDYNFFDILAQIAKRRGQVKLKLHFYLLENHFDWSDAQRSHLTIDELVTEIGLAQDGEYPDPAVVRRACRNLGYVPKEAPLGRPRKRKS